MEGPRYRQEPRPADLNQRRRPLRPEYLRVLWRGILVLALLAAAVGWILRQPKRVVANETPPVATIPPEAISRLAGTLVEAATAKLEQNRPDEALALMATALQADPAADDARMLAEKILREAVWHFPALTIRHPLPVEHLLFSHADTLWVGLSGETSTVVRWDPTQPKLESVLFPVRETAVRSLVADPTGGRLVVERAGFLLLCDARTLKPVADLGLLPDFVTPAAVVVFSADGLLLAHPAFVGHDDRRLVWQLRDAVSGQILRSHEPSDEEDKPRPLTAFLDRSALRVLHADGRMLEIPVSPIQPAQHHRAAREMVLPHAQFSADGASWLALVDHGPHQAREIVHMPDDAPGNVVTALSGMIRRFPWSRQPGIWNGLLRESSQSPLFVETRTVIARDGAHVPIRMPAEVTAVARQGDMVMVGCGDGSVVSHQLLPKPFPLDAAQPSAGAPDEAAAMEFYHLTNALCGVRHDEDERHFEPLAAAERQQAATKCDAERLRLLFPSLDFKPVLEALRTIAAREAPPEGMDLLTARLARADSSGEGNPAVAALALALDSSLPGTIAECLAAVENPPPLLRKLAESRIAWLDGRKAEALSGWPEEFPDLQKIRLREDWDGWEQTDFGPPLENFRQLIQQELARLELPNDATPEQRKELVARLTNPETARIFGRVRVGRACLKAAQALSSFADEAEACLALATIAGNFGADPAACLRAEANALAALGRHDQAHERWISLITEQPVEARLPADYAEAAYTAFETSEPVQAMEILSTGIQRFPNDSEFAMRAGWIALLTGNPDHAYRFLLTGSQAGFPPAKREHSAALLAIAAAQCGQAFEAGEFYQELIALNPAWQDPATIEALQWPEELKSTLRQLTW
jgi:tetratricopeptide (TPR) repeat protein